MKLTALTIRNYRSCKDVALELKDMHALVGANNAGKSSILRALDLLFNPSVSKVNEQTFWNGDTTRRIWIEALFQELTETEREKLNGYLRDDGSFLMARSVEHGQAGDGDGDSEAAESKVVIGQHYCKQVPKYGWLRPSEISGANIDSWWKTKDALVANGSRFADRLGTSKPNVAKWKEEAERFASEVLTPDDYEAEWIDNPRGYAGVLKAALPCFVFVPAVRDACDEAKVTKSNPLGRILYAVLSSVTDEQQEALKMSLGDVARMLNREGGTERMAAVAAAEERLNKVLSEHMESEIEIEFQPPSLETLLTTPKLFVDDGFRNTIENKGHGLQRAVILSILRCYSELVTGVGRDRKRGLILAVEEPELYMHPQAQRTMRRVLKQIAEGGDQVLFSTHSSLLVDVAHFDEIIRVEGLPVQVDQRKTVETKVWQLPLRSLIDDLVARHPRATPTDRSIRELYANAYHPYRAEGFFAKRILLVEGPTEQYALPIYAEALGLTLDTMNVAVVDCNGKGPIDRLYRVFNELGIPCYMLFDYDASNADANVVATSKSLLALADYPDLTAPAQTLVTDTFACFREKWEHDLAPEIPNCDARTATARTELGLSSDSGKPLTARYIARELVAEGTVPQTVREILKRATKVAWRGTCLKKAEPAAATVQGAPAQV